MKCIVKKDGNKSTMTVDQAMEQLEPGVIVDCYDNKGELEGCFGCVSSSDVSDSTSNQKPEPSNFLRCTLQG